ncbi:MAG: transposase [bacterium]
MIKRDSKGSNGSNEDDVQGFINTFRERIAAIIEHYEVYRDFSDKLPGPSQLSEGFLREFITGLGRNEIPERSLLAPLLKSGAKRYVRKRLNQIISADCRTFHQNVHSPQGPNGALADQAENRLRGYEINVLNILNRLSERDGAFYDHTRIGKKVIDQFTNQVIRNGTNDNNGDPIDNHYSYILKIIESRIKDEKNRNRPVCILSGDLFDFFESPNGRDVIEKVINNKQVDLYLRNRFYPRISPVDGFIFRTYFLEEEYNQDDIRRRVYELFGKSMSIAGISRRLKRLIEIIRQDLTRAPFDLDAIIEMVSHLNKSPLEPDWLFLFLDLKYLKGFNPGNKKRRSMNLIGYGLTTDAEKRIIVEKTCNGYEGPSLWLDELRAIKERGMMRVLMLTTEDHPELEHYIGGFFPKVDYQFPFNKIYQKARKFLFNNDWDIFHRGLEEILACSGINEGYEQLCALCYGLRGRCDGEGKKFIDALAEKADHILPCLQYPPEIRRIISKAMACRYNQSGKETDSKGKKVCNQEKELMARLKTSAEELFTKNLARHDDAFRRVLPQLMEMFNQRFQAIS